MYLRKTILSGVALALLLLLALNPVYGAPQAEMETSNVNAEGGQAGQNEAMLPGGVVNIVDVTNLRSGPGLEFEVVGKAMPGDSFPIVGFEGDWHQVSLDSGNTAYVASWVVETEAPVYAVNIVEVTNLRSGPGLEYKIVAKAQAGEVYQITGTAGEWYQISLPSGGKVYVAGWVVKVGLFKPQTQSQKKVYIYHTHNRESWKNVVRNPKGVSFDDPEVNITLVGKHLGKLLDKKGIPALVGEEDYTELLRVKKLSFGQSYAESRKIVNKAKADNPSLSYFFDIHRDADVPRKTTTAAIKGKSYARILFVIGTAHPNYAANKKLAEALHQGLNKKYPGVSRGILSKSAHQGNGEYNQSLSPGSLLLEIGGVNNTLEESLLAAEAFADVFAEYIKSLK